MHFIEIKLDIFNVLKFFDMKGKEDLGITLLQKIEEKYQCMKTLYN